MNINKNEVNSSNIHILPSKSSDEMNKENFLDASKSSSNYINKSATSIKHNNLERANMKKKYKKNLIWDGPRWDLAYFDPTMSARERKKLIYYETLFSKLENSNEMLKYSGNNSNNLKSNTHKRRIRNNIISTNTKTTPQGENKETKEVDLERNISRDSTKLDENRDESTGQIPFNSLDPEKTEFLATPNRNQLVNGENKVTSESSERQMISNVSIQCSSVEVENSCNRKYQDWRIKLLNKKSSFQSTPYRTSTP
ncbi:hypothetical protein HWI79_1443 [Cryptosporidium felis]|nr:hypothetical protein HWI79_1443 [Cryptosporidium felis]